jgi:hypothetical protein
MALSGLELHLRIVGISLICLALMHFTLPKKFQWKSELSSLSLFNRHMFVVQCFFVALNSFLMGMVCLFYAGALAVKSELGLAISVWLLIYWGCRLYCQFFVYPTQLWRGHNFETAMHVLFSFLWLYYVLVFGSVCFQQIRG